MSQNVAIRQLKVGSLEMKLIMKVKSNTKVGLPRTSTLLYVPEEAAMQKRQSLFLSPPGASVIKLFPSVSYEFS